MSVAAGRSRAAGGPRRAASSVAVAAGRRPTLADAQAVETDVWMTRLNRELDPQAVGPVGYRRQNGCHGSRGSRYRSVRIAAS
jgi:hypothetical protein